jgi:tetratricopeptide (TPR) repeat protein
VGAWDCAILRGTVATNPRIDDLRRRLDREPQSRLFAQLAEELRKEGELREAIQVARRGLEKHPNYPSARMTLGRALFDSREFGNARSEFESVLKGAPDNILASRLLAECLEALGDVPGAIERYKATLVFSPGDKQVLGRLQALERPGPAAATPPPPSLSATANREPSPPEPPASRPQIDPDMAPIPLVAADEEFELEHPFQSPSTSWAGSPRSSLAFEPLREEPPAAPIEEKAVGTEPAAPEAPASPPAAEPSVEPAAVAATPDAPPPPVAALEVTSPLAPGADLASPTLAELYFNQGALDRAIEAYRRLIEREPFNGRFRARLAEIEALERHLRAEEAPAPAPSPPPPADPVRARREHLENTVARLEELLAAIKRGVRA